VTAIAVDDEINKGLPLDRQILRLDYIQPKRWWMRPTFRVVLPLYFLDVTVESGFVTDMGTIPRFLWWLFDPINRYGRAVVIHDKALHIMQRDNADNRFREALKAENVEGVRAIAMYRAVSVYGKLERLLSSIFKSGNGRIKRK